MSRSIGDDHAQTPFHLLEMNAILVIILFQHVSDISNIWEHNIEHSLFVFWIWVKTNGIVEFIEFLLVGIDFSHMEDKI